jgi:hypothetical protein
MTWFNVAVYAYMPYKRGFAYRLVGSSESVVASKAVRMFRKEPTIKGRRLPEVNIKVVRVSKEVSYVEN